MKVLAHTPEYVPAIVRYVEAKCLVAGTTTSQGIALSSYAGIQRFYRGIVRNVEQTDEDDLPEAATHIADVVAKDRAKFLKRLESLDCLLLHLSEGTDDRPPARTSSRSRRRPETGRSRARWPGSTASRSRRRTSRCSPRPGRRWSGRRSATCSSTARPPT